MYKCCISIDIAKAIPTMQRVFYYLYDGHGDVRALLNEAGRITDKYRYNAYGELIEKTGDTENHYLYTREYYDGTSNLYYLRARYMNPATGNFLTMDTYEGSIYDPDTLHKYMYANGNPVTYSDPSGNMFDFSSTAMGMGIQNVLNNAVQISYRGLMCGLINMTLTAVMGGSWEQAKSSFVTGFILGAGISVVRYFAVGAELVTLARFYVLSASANFIFSATMTVFAVTKGYSNLAVTFGVMVILSIAEWCWAYGNYLLIDVYGNNGSATIECNPSGGSEEKPPVDMQAGSKQLGKKWGKHKFDYSNLNTYTDYEQFAKEIFNNPDKIIFDSANNEYLYIKGDDLLRIQVNGQFISLYPGADSAKVTNAVESGGLLWEK